MHNRFHARLILPFLFDIVPITDNSKNKSIPTLDSNSEFVKWLASLNLEVVRTGIEQFYIPPGGKGPIHSDGKTIDDKINLNFQYQGAGSKMKWYTLVDTELKLHATSSRSNYQSFADKDEVKQIWEAEIGFPSLVNVGMLHSVENGPEPRWVIAVPLWDKVTDTRLQWDEAVVRFQQWIVKEDLNAESY
jgi:hypothetical protein